MEDVAPLELARTVVLVSLAVLASGSDLRYNRIPNAITVPAFLLGVALAGVDGSGPMLGHLAAAAVMLLLGIGLFAVKLLGGGDVKMMVAVAAIVGPAPLPEALLLACLVGGIMALVDSLRRRRFLVVLRNTRDMVAHWASFGRSGKPLADAAEATAAIPYGVAIGAGALLAWFI